MQLAVTHTVSPQIQRCQLTYIDRHPIDYNRAVEQHGAYCEALRGCGVEVVEISENISFPDSCFIEDTAIVLDEVAVIARMGTVSRQDEPRGVEDRFAQYRELRHIDPPATIEGGDVVRIGRTIFVGRSSRTNERGADALSIIVARYGYRVVPVDVRGGLHLTTACSVVAENKLLVNARWIDTTPFDGFELIPVPEQEPWAANTIRIGDAILIEAGAPRTASMLMDIVPCVIPVDISELRKAEGSLSCLSKIFHVE